MKVDILVPLPEIFRERGLTRATGYRRLAEVDFLMVKRGVRGWSYRQGDGVLDSFSLSLFCQYLVMIEESNLRIGKRRFLEYLDKLSGDKKNDGHNETKRQNSNSKQSGETDYGQFFV